MRFEILQNKIYENYFLIFWTKHEVFLTHIVNWNKEGKYGFPLQLKVWIEAIGNFYAEGQDFDAVFPFAIDFTLGLFMQS